MYDIVIIGAGVTGCSIARALSAYTCSITVLERASDICEGTSKANSGIVHAGFDCTPGTLMARLNLIGSKMMPSLAEELDIPYRQNGSLVLCFSDEQIPALHELKARGEANGVEGLRVLDRAELLALEPHISAQAVAALYAPTGGIVCPFGLTIALAENAAANGAEFFRGTAVTGIDRTQTGYTLHTNRGDFETRFVINAAGVYSDAIHNMVSADKMTIVPRKGEYCLADRNAGALVSHTVFQLPTKYGKGVLVTPTVHGNLLIGPTAVDIEDKENTATTQEGLADVLKRAALSVDALPTRQIITSFTGLRAHRAEHDFVIGEIPDAPGFIDAAAMESPGLSSAPAVGEMVRDLVLERSQFPKKEHFISRRKGIPQVSSLSPEARAELIRRDARYANVICRCETVTEGEIVEAIHRPVGATTLDGIKRRTRAGMGRCQAGFCSPKTVAILARELGVDEDTITKCGPGSEFFE